MESPWLHPSLLWSNTTSTNSSWTERSTCCGKGRPSRHQIQRISTCMHRNNPNNFKRWNNIFYIISKLYCGTRRSPEISEHANQHTNHGLQRDTEDALLVQLESQHSPSCVHILRQIPRDELVKLLPESWVTNYEKLHDRSTLIQSMDSSIHRRKDGAMEIAFKQQEEKPRPAAFYTEINTISPIDNNQKEQKELAKHLPGIPIEFFYSLGDPVYSFAYETGHKFFDICDCEKCLMNSSDEDETPRRRKKKSSQQILKERYESGDPQTVYSENQAEEILNIMSVQTQPLSFSQDPSIFGSSSFLPKMVAIERQAIKRKQSTGKEKEHIPSTSKPQTPPERNDKQFMVEHANPITTFLEKVAYQERNPKRQTTTTMSENIKDEPAEEVLIPHFMMAEPTVEEEDMESDDGRIYEER
ncbi:unnamed protein product [Arabidopsis thaliana]|uniref:Uncharacterized protein n=1 Tax=Arabidopsis thaliana TaxID=3702 RepID=A0A654EKU9_ARATH|nr:unnamed protein product [Arabidopsis thaliana]